MGFEIQHSTDLIVLGSKERNIAGESGGVQLQRSFMFQADFNGWTGELGCSDIHRNLGDV